jgi:hypothetical protein
LKKAKTKSKNLGLQSQKEGHRLQTIKWWLARFARIQTKGLLSTLWIFVTINYLYCDLMTLMDASKLKQFLTGTVGGMQFTQGFLLGSAILMEIPIAMIFLARILKYKANRWANLMAGTIMTIAQTASLFTGTPSPFYIFFSTIEISCTVFIVWRAWNWSESA